MSGSIRHCWLVVRSCGVLRLEGMGTEALDIAGALGLTAHDRAGDGIATGSRSLIGAHVQTTQPFEQTSHFIALWRRRSCPPFVSRHSCPCRVQSDLPLAELNNSIHFTFRKVSLGICAFPSLRYMLL